MKTSAAAWIVDSKSRSTINTNRMVYIENIDDIFSTINLDAGRAREWFSKNGIKSVDDEGNSIVPEFPCLSRLFWLSVEDEIFSGPDLAELSRECSVAISRSKLNSTKILISSIRSLANSALEEGLQLAMGKA